jgi:hypothetical protein
MTSIQGLAVEFDDVAVGVEDVDLRVARWGFGAKLHLSEVVVWKIAAETFACEPRYRIAIALYAQGEMNVGKVDPLAAAERCFRANQDVELRQSINQSCTRFPDGQSSAVARVPAFLGRQCRTVAHVPGRLIHVQTGIVVIGAVTA